MYPSSVKMFVPIVYDFSEIFKRFRPAWGFSGQIGPTPRAGAYILREKAGWDRRLNRARFTGRARPARRIQIPHVKRPHPALKPAAQPRRRAKRRMPPPRPAASPLQTPTLLPLSGAASCHCHAHLLAIVTSPSCHCREPPLAIARAPPLAIARAHPLAIVRSHPLAIVGKI